MAPRLDAQVRVVGSGASAGAGPGWCGLGGWSRSARRCRRETPSRCRCSCRCGGVGTPGAGWPHRSGRRGATRGCGRGDSAVRLARSPGKCTGVARDDVLPKIGRRVVDGPAVVEQGAAAGVVSSRRQTPSAARRRVVSASMGPYPASSPGTSSRPSRVPIGTVTCTCGRRPARWARRARSMLVAPRPARRRPDAPRGQGFPALDPLVAERLLDPVCVGVQPGHDRRGICRR